MKHYCLQFVKNEAELVRKDLPVDLIFNISVANKIGCFQEISIPYHGWHEHFNPSLPSEMP